MQFRVHTCSKIGLRENQEDRACTVAIPGGVIVAVADGLGGHAAGEVASALAVHAIQHSPGTLADRLTTAHLHVRAAGRVEGQQGLGTTLTAAKLTSNPPALDFAHCGDSRLYRIRGGKLQRVTRDHSIAGALLFYGHITEEAFDRGEGHQAIVQYVGMDQKLAMDTGSFALQIGDVVVLTTDGVHGALTPAQFLAMVQGSGGSATKISTRLVEEALDLGGEDNATAVAIVVE